MELLELFCLAAGPLLGVVVAPLALVVIAVASVRRPKDLLALGLALTATVVG